MASERPWREQADGAALRARVTPKARRDAPASGAVDEAVRRRLAKALGRPTSAATLRSGVAKLKMLAVSGEPGALAGLTEAEERS